MPMLESLRIPRFKVELSLEYQDGEVIHPTPSGKLFARPNEFVYLCARVHNADGKPLLSEGGL